MRRIRGSARFVGFLALALAVAGLVMAPGHVQAAPSEDEVRERLEEAFNADVLELREAELNGEEVWIARIMRHGGTHNAAFQVDSIVVDRSTGEPQLGVRVDDRRPAAALTQERRPEVLRDFFQGPRGLRTGE